jgi:hypothetical protein
MRREVRGCGRPGFAPARRPLRFELQIGLDQQVVLPHHPKHALLIDWKLLHEVQIRPDPPLPPKRMLSLERLDVGEPACITLPHLSRPPPRQPRSSSPF